MKKLYCKPRIVATALYAISSMCETTVGGQPGEIPTRPAPSRLYS